MQGFFLSYLGNMFRLEIHFELKQNFQVLNSSLSTLYAVIWNMHSEFQHPGTGC